MSLTGVQNELLKNAELFGFSPLDRVFRSLEILETYLPYR